MIKYIVIGLIVAFILFLLIKTFLFKPVKKEEVKLVMHDFDKKRSVETLKELVMCKTVSYEDETKEDYNEFIKLEEKIDELFPLIHKNCEKKKLGHKSLLFKLSGETHEKATVLMAHYDVVPVEEELWDHEAFSGYMDEKCLWGRGTLDTKGTLNGILNALEYELANGFKPKRDIYLCFAGNEETTSEGAKVIVKYLQENKIDIDYVIDEGGAVVNGVFPGVKEDCALVGIAEKGLFNVELSIKGQGGHASAPPRKSAIGKLSKAVLAIEKHPFKAKYGDPALKMFDTLGRKSNFACRFLFANLWLFRPVLNSVCKKSGGELNALIRTTTAFTQMEGSKALNVFPPQASIRINCRIISGETMDSTIANLKKRVHNTEIEVNAINGNDPSIVSKTDYRFDELTKAINETWEGAIVSPYLMIACSDSRSYGVLTDHVYRFSAMKLSSEERGMIHGNNERIPFETIHKTVEFYINVIKNL